MAPSTSWFTRLYHPALQLAGLRFAGGVTSAQRKAWLLRVELFLRQDLFGRICDLLTCFLLPVFIGAPFTATATVPGYGYGYVHVVNRAAYAGNIPAADKKSGPARTWRWP